MVHADGTKLVDGAGNPVRLRGVNLGGWLLWEGWIWGGGFQSEGELMKRFTELVGERDALAFRQQVHERFVTDDDFARIAAMGFDSVRVPFNHRLLEDPVTWAERPAGWATLDRAVASASAHGLRVVLDLHGAPGGQSPYFIADPDGASLWKDPVAQRKTVELWRAIAARYASERHIAGYDLLNEPIPPSGDDLAQLDARIATAIREVDREHLLIVEGADFARDFRSFACPIDPNIAYSFHIYTFFGQDARAPLATWSKLPTTQSVPLFCGEFGENRPEVIASTVSLFEEPRYEVTAGWSFWTWKRAKDSFPALNEIVLPASWKAVMAWTQHPLLAARPTPDEAKRAMAEFLDACAPSALVVGEAMAAALRHAGG